LQSVEEEVTGSSKTQEADQDRDNNPPTVEAMDSDVRTTADQS